MKLEEILVELANRIVSKSTPMKYSIELARDEIIELLPKKREEVDYGIVKEAAYGYGDWDKGYNKAIEDIQNNLKGKI